MFEYCLTKYPSVIAQPMRNPGQLMLDNIDNLSIQTLLDVIQPDGKEVDISVPSTSYCISGCFTKPLKVVAQKSHLDTTDDETMTKSIKPREVQKTVNTT